MGVCLHIYMCTTCIQCLQNPEGGFRSPRTDITNSCKLLCGCWELNLGFLRKSEVILNTKPFLHPPPTFIMYMFMVAYGMLLI